MKLYHYNKITHEFERETNARKDPKETVRYLLSAKMKSG